MAWQLKKTVAVAAPLLDVEDAEILLNWLLETPGGKVNLRDNEHLHTAVAQVLMASRVEISVPPKSPAQQALLHTLDVL